MKHCPTNMDPNYDKKPSEFYVCKSCGARGEHQTTLCPSNELSWSLTQRRRDAGISTHHDLQCSDYNRSRQSDCSERGSSTERHMRNSSYGPMGRDGRPPGSRHSSISDGEVPFRAVRHARRCLGNDEWRDGNHNRTRRPQGKRALSRHQPPQSERSSFGHRSPPHKRSRTDKEYRERVYGNGCERYSNYRHGSGDDQPDYALPSSRASSRTGVGTDKSRYELLPKTILKYQKNSGRLLSYMDVPYGSESKKKTGLQATQATQATAETSLAPEPESARSYVALTEASTNKRLSAADFIREMEISTHFPAADILWVKQMASFDANAFFCQLNDYMSITNTPNTRQSTLAGKENVIDLTVDDVYSPWSHVMAGGSSGDLAEEISKTKQSEAGCHFLVKGKRDNDDSGINMEPQGSWIADIHSHDGRFSTAQSLGDCEEDHGQI